MPLELLLLLVQIGASIDEFLSHKENQVALSDPELINSALEKLEKNPQDSERIKLKLQQIIDLKRG